jgi:acetate kinase
MQRYQIRKFVGSYVAAMDGVDAIVFTAASEKTHWTTASVCNNLSSSDKN